MEPNRRTRRLQAVLELQCQTYKVLSHPARLAIVELLSHQSRGAADLIVTLRTSKANLSKHMALLARSGIVGSTRHGKRVYYRLIDPELQEACAAVRSVLYQRLRQKEKTASPTKSS